LEGYKDLAVNQSSAANDTYFKTLDKKLMMGYQGWFACPAKIQPSNGTLPRANSWWHWFKDGDMTAPSDSIPLASNLIVDMWPDIRVVIGISA
jgi:hypothetical protein